MGKNYIILSEDDLKFMYEEKELIAFRRHWNNAKRIGLNSIETINMIAPRMDLSPDNVALIALDQARKGEID